MYYDEDDMLMLSGIQQSPPHAGVWIETYTFHYECYSRCL